MTAPGRNHLMRLGVRRHVAQEYRRLLSVGVSPAAAVILARGKSRPRRCPQIVDRLGDNRTERDAPRS